MTGVNSSLHRLLWYLPMLGMAICYSLTSLPLRAADQVVVNVDVESHSLDLAVLIPRLPLAPSMASALAGLSQSISM